MYDELSSKIEFMKSRALLLYSKYTFETFTDQHVYEVGLKILDCMGNDNSFPVKTIAAVTLKNFIGYEATS